MGFSRGRSGGLVFRSLEDIPEFVVVHIVKGFGIVNKAEMDVILELSCFFDDPVDIGDLTSGSSAFSKFSLNPWRRAWQPTPIFLSGKYHGQRILRGYHPWCHKRVGHGW